MDGIRRDILTATVGHKPGGAQFAHVGVDKVVIGSAVHPVLPTGFMGFHVRMNRFPLDPKLAPDSISMLHRDESKVVPPKQLKNQPVCAFIGFDFMFIAQNLRVDLPSAEASPGEPRTEFARIVVSQQTVARLFVATQ